MHKSFGNHFIWLFCLIICLAPPQIPELSALDRGLDLNLSAQEEYNDNIFYTVNDEIDDYITTVSGGLTYRNRTERSNANLSARIEKLFYQDQEDLDATDQFYDVKLDHVLTSRWKTGVSGGFIRDSRPDRDIDTTGLVLGTAERNRLNGSVFASLRATENTDATLTYSHFDEDYDQDLDQDQDQGQDEFSDSTGHQVGLGFAHNWGRVFQNTTLQFYLNHGRYEYDSADIQVSSGTLGFSKTINELWVLSISGGARYQETEITRQSTGPMTVAPEKLEDDKWGSVWNMDLNYQGEFGRFGLYGKHDITPSSGLDGTTERTSLGVRFYYRVAQKSGVGLNVNYYINKADAGELAREDVDSETWRISPHAKISLMDDLYLIARYHYSQVENQISNNTASRQYAVLKLAYSITLWD